MALINSDPIEIQPSGKPSDLQGQVINAQRQDYKNRFAPLEDRLIKMVGEDGNKQADIASRDIRKQSKITRRSFNRDIQRSGTRVTEEQKVAINRSRGLDLARSQANAENSTRKTVADQNMDVTANLIGIGRDVQQGVNRDLSTAANLQSGREQAGASAKASSRAQTTSMISTGLGLAAAIFL